MCSTETKYWTKFYKQTSTCTPSDFAQYVTRVIPKSYHIIDMGCGNGRDSIFFRHEGYSVHGIDMADTAMSDTFGDFTSKDVISQCSKENNCYYMRFTLHSIDEDAENSLLETFGSLEGYVAIEARSTKGIIPDNTHYRRLVDAAKVRDTLEALGYEMLFFAEGIGMAQYGDKDPVVFRLIARRTERSTVISRAEIQGRHT